VGGGKFRERGPYRGGSARKRKNRGNLGAFQKGHQGGILWRLQEGGKRDTMGRRPDDWKGREGEKGKKRDAHGKQLAGGGRSDPNKEEKVQAITSSASLILREYSLLLRGHHKEREAGPTRNRNLFGARYFINKRRNYRGERGDLRFGNADLSFGGL